MDVQSTETRSTRPGQVTELHASAHLMTLGTGLYCVFRQSDGQQAVPPDHEAADRLTAMPAVSVTLPPAGGGGVRISASQPGGWLVAGRDAVLVRVDAGPADVLVTVYRVSAAQPAPRLQVQLLSSDADAQPATRAQAEPGAAAPAVPSFDPEHPPALVAHVHRRGDVGGAFGERLGAPGSGLWMEGFSITPPAGIDAAEFEYQAVLGRDWLSPWVSGGQFCGSRGMALPLLGLNVRLRGTAATLFAATLEASFCDGTAAGPVPATGPLASAAMAPLESFRLVLSSAETTDAPAATAAAAAAASTAKKAAARRR